MKKSSKKPEPEVELTVQNYNAVMKKFGPLIDKFTYSFYNKYHTVLDYEDARQEVLLCLFKCLSKFSPGQYKFITYFYGAFNRLSSRFYWSYFHQSNLSLRKDEGTKSTDGKNIVSDSDESKNDQTQSAERFVDQSYRNHDIRPYLTPESQEVYDVYMNNYKISSWLVSKELGLSRYHAKERFDSFLAELNELCNLSSKKAEKKNTIKYVVVE